MHDELLCVQELRCAPTISSSITDNLHKDRASLKNLTVIPDACRVHKDLGLSCKIATFNILELLRQSLPGTSHETKTLFRDPAMKTSPNPTFKLHFHFIICFSGKFALSSSCAMGLGVGEACPFSQEDKHMIEFHLEACQCLFDAGLLICLLDAGLLICRLRR